jgi:hypothetical protein
MALTINLIGMIIVVLQIIVGAVLRVADFVDHSDQLERVLNRFILADVIATSVLTTKVLLLLIRIILGNILFIMLVLIVLIFSILANEYILVIIFLIILLISFLTLVNMDAVDFESRQRLAWSQGSLIDVSHGLITKVIIDIELIILRKLLWGFIVVCMR